MHVMTEMLLRVNPSELFFLSGMQTVQGRYFIASAFCRTPTRSTRTRKVTALILDVNCTRTLHVCVRAFSDAAVSFGSARLYKYSRSFGDLGLAGWFNVRRSWSTLLVVIGSVPTATLLNVFGSSISGFDALNSLVRAGHDQSS